MLVDRFFVEVLEFFFYQKIHLHLKLLFYKYINFTLKYALEGSFYKKMKRLVIFSVQKML